MDRLARRGNAFSLPRAPPGVDDAERFEMLLEVLDELREANKATPILVEGQRDITSLRALGMPGAVVALNQGTTLFNVAEVLGAQVKEIILLTDWDSKGQQLFDRMRAQLAANGVRCIVSFRDDLRHAIRPTLPDVESLASYVKRGLEKHRPVTGTQARDW